MRYTSKNLLPILTNLALAMSTMKDSTCKVNPYDVIIVGGGLSGLVVARNLPEKRWKLLEASERLGGRLQNDIVSDKIDLGGAWVWPQQRQMSRLCTSLGIDFFTQPDDPSSLRIVGGAANIIKKLVNELNENAKDDESDSGRIETGAPVVACRRESDSLVSVDLASGETLYAKNVVFACPPRLVHMHVQFHPSLSISKARAMEFSQTWMAGVTKVALVYHKPRFWPLYESNGGFQPGYNRPAFQVYDATPRDESVSALTFFTLASLSNKENDDAKLARDCAEQMSQSFSTQTLREIPNIAQDILAYDEFYVQRWPQEKYISEDADPRGIAPHPQPLFELATSEWDGMLLFAGTESDQMSPGVMEGAVNAALRVADEINRRLSNQ
jgi:monoamine oxidase